MKIQLPQLSKKTSQPSLICDICLIVYGNVLLHAEQPNVVALPDESLLKLTATELAQAARRLLPNTNKQQRIALALPSSEFVATSLVLPSIAPQNLKSAVNLQLPTLLPGVTEPLLLAVQAQPISGQPTIALWMSAQRAEELFQAFGKEGLFLGCILPRPLLALPPSATRKIAASAHKNTRKTSSLTEFEKIPDLYQIYDEDDTNITCIEWSHRVLQRWLQVPKSDCESPEFTEQLQRNLQVDSVTQTIRKTQTNEWANLQMPAALIYNYAFVPPGAILYISQLAKQKKRRHLYMLVSLLIIALLLGLFTVFNYEHRLKKRLAGLRDRTKDTSKLREEVVQIEQYVAPIKNFPQQNIVMVLENLDRLIPKDSWIISCKVEAGNVEVEGYSSNPSRLLEILSTEKLFSEVAFSRPNQTEMGKLELKFGIRFKLVGIDVPAYWLEYFPIEK